MVPISHDAAVPRWPTLAARTAIRTVILLVRRTTVITVALMMLGQMGKGRGQLALAMRT